MVYDTGVMRMSILSGWLGCLVTGVNQALYMVWTRNNLSSLIMTPRYRALMDGVSLCT
jgi:hypothetical protein